MEESTKAVMHLLAVAGDPATELAATLIWEMLTDHQREVVLRTHRQWQEEGMAHATVV